jgi:hypothetical protein
MHRFNTLTATRRRRLTLLILPVLWLLPSTAPAARSYDTLLNTLGDSAHNAQELKRWVQGQSPDHENWRLYVVAESHLATLEGSDDLKRLIQLKGLNPDVYKKKRRPEPEAVSELARASISPAVAMTHYLYDLVSKQGALAKNLGAEKHQEGLALAQAILLNVGRSSHPAAFFFLKEILNQNKTHPALRRVAYIAVGGTRSPGSVALLERALVQHREDSHLATGVIQGLAYNRDLEALRVIAQESQKATSLAVRHAGLLAIATFTAASNPTVKQTAADHIITWIEQADLRVSGATVQQAIQVANSARVDEYLNGMKVLKTRPRHEQWLQQTKTLRSFAKKRNARWRP